MTRIIASFLLIFIGSICLSGQFNNVLERLNNGKYKFGNRVGKMHQLEDVFKQDSIAHMHFLKFNRARKRQRTANFVSTGLFVATIAGGIAAYNGRDGDLGAVIVLVNGTAITSLVAIIGNASSGLSKGKHKGRLIEYVNTSAVRVANRIYATNPFPRSLKYLGNKNTWELDAKVYNDLSELTNDLAFDEVSQSLYMDYSHNHNMKKRTRNYAYVFGGLTASGMIVNRTFVDRDTRRDGMHNLITQVLPLVATLVSVSRYHRRSKQEKRARRQFLNYINGLPTDITFDETPKLEVAGTANGLGIAYRL